MSGPGYIRKEKESVCAFCEQVAELRPYGPNGESICFNCAMKNEGAAQKQMRRVVFGEEIEYPQ